MNKDAQPSVPARDRGPACNLVQYRRWQELLGRLQEFDLEHGIQKLKTGTVLNDGYQLGTKVTYYRSAYAKGHLLHEQIAALEAFPGWTWNKHQRLWDDGIAALTVFAEREGHCSVPRKHVESGIQLGSWVDNKRKNYRNGTLTAARIAQLEVFPTWDWGPYDDRWWPDYEIFKAHVLGGGTPEPVRSTVVAGLEIFAWCRQQHSRHRSRTLSADAVSALESVPGWTWKTKHSVQERRESAQSIYRRFVWREGHGQVPLNHNEKGFRLGHYLGNARSRVNMGVLPEALWPLLDAVSTDWRQPLPGTRRPTALQEKAIARYRRFVDREGHGRVPTQHIEWGFDLGKYLSGARYRSSTRQSSAVLEARIDSVSTDWRLSLRSPIITDLTSHLKAA